MSLPAVRFGPWDLWLVIAVAFQATALAYLRQPRWKAFMLSLPVPSTLMMLALNRPVDASNVLGLFFLLLFTHGVRVTHQDLKVPILPAIGLSALGYCVLGTLVAPILPRTPLSFGLAWAFITGLGYWLYRRLPARREREYRTLLPVWIKLPLIALVVVFLVLVRNSLQGFATVFPMVGVIAAYESRYCLWTIGRQIPVLMMAIGMLMGVAYLVQPYAGLPLALLAGWGAFLLVFGVITIQMWSKKGESA